MDQYLQKSKLNATCDLYFNSLHQRLAHSLDSTSIGGFRRNLKQQLTVNYSVWYFKKKLHFDIVIFVKFTLTPKKQVNVIQREWILSFIWIVIYIQYRYRS